MTPAKETATGLPWVHVTIANLKRVLLGTYHGVSPEKLQRYLNEFCYRFNRGFYLLQTPYRLAVTALKVKACHAFGTLVNKHN